MNNCVCGFDPPNDPNPDCERCQLICKVARLEKENAILKKQLEFWAES